MATGPSLPTEMIQAIFSQLCLHPDENVATAVAVSLVSRHWRAVALATPSLWSTFSFPLQTYDESRLSAFFERSRPEHPDITMSFDYPKADEDEISAGKVQRAIALFNRNAYRIEHLRLGRAEPLHGGMWGDRRGLAAFLQMLDAPALISLTIYDQNEHLADLLVMNGVCFPNVTRFCVVPGGEYRSLFEYTICLPGVEELVLRGDDWDLFCSIVGLRYEDWPRLRTLDLSLLDPPNQCLGNFWANLYHFARERVQSDSPSQMLVRLPPGILPQDLPSDVAQFMDLQTT